MTAPLDFALAYARLGVTVAPMWPGLKALHSSREHPERSLLGEGFALDTVGSQDEEQLRAWWEAEPSAGVAVVCGARSRLVVIDVDPRNGGDRSWEGWVVERAEEGLVLPDDLPLVSTPRGGYQFWVQLPVGVDVRGRTLGLPGVDVLGSEHWAGAPPSTVRDVGAYTWQRPGHLQEVPWLLERVQPRRARGGASASSGALDGTSVTFDWERAHTPGAVPPGEQHDTLVAAAGSLRAKRADTAWALHQLRLVIRCFEDGDPDRPWLESDAEEVWEFARARWDEGTAEDPDAQRALAERISAGIVDRSNGSSPSPSEDTEEDEHLAEVVQLQPGQEAANRNTDRANAEDFARLFRLDACWTPELGWLVWDGRRWAVDDRREVELLCQRLADALLDRRRTAPDDDRGILLQRATRLEQVAGVRSTLAYVEPMLVRSLSEFDTHPWLLNCLNGTVDLRTGERREHRPADLLTRLAPTEYHPDARDAVWERALSHLCGERVRDDHEGAAKRRFYRRYLGYSLTGSTREKDLLALNGPPDTGKTTVSEPLLAVLGDVSEGGYATTWEAETIQARSNVNRAEKLHKAYGARVVLVGELEKGTRLADGFVKRFTGGNSVDAKRLYHDSYTYRPQAKLWLDTNYLSRSADVAVHNRLKLLPCTHTVRRKDEGVKQHLLQDPGARQAVLAEAVRGCLEWQAEGFGELPWLERELRRFALGSDATLAFVEEVFERVDPEDTSLARGCAPVEGVWFAYQMWASENVSKPLRKGVLASALEEHGLRKHRLPKGGATVWLGLRVREQLPSSLEEYRTHLGTR